MRPKPKQVEVALDKISLLGARCYAPAHGPVVRYSLSRFTYDYRQWCQGQKSQELSVALLYASAYGNTAILANAIAQGLVQNGVNVESINCELADSAEINRIVETLRWLDYRLTYFRRPCTDSNSNCFRNSSLCGG